MEIYMEIHFMEVKKVCSCQVCFGCEMVSLSLSVSGERSVTGTALTYSCDLIVSWSFWDPPT